MATRKSENTSSDDKSKEVKPELPKDVTKQSILKDLDFVIQSLSTLEVFTNPKLKTNRTLADIMSLGNKAATTCVRKLEEIKAKL